MISALEARSVICICLGAWWVCNRLSPAAPPSYHHQWWGVAVSTAGPCITQGQPVLASVWGGHELTGSTTPGPPGHPTLRDDPQLPPVQPAYLPCTQVRSPLGHIGTTGVRAVQRPTQPVQDPQGHRINPAQDPPWGGDDGCRTMRKPLRIFR